MTNGKRGGKLVSTLAPIAGGIVLLLTAFVLRELFHIHGQPVVLISILVGGIVIVAIIRISKRAQDQSSDEEG